MRLFNAAIYTNNFDIGGGVYSKLTENEQGMRRSCQNYLESYHYIHGQRYVDKIRKDGIKVFLDSGAFSAFTQNVTVDIEKYCDYCLENADIIEQASVLDAIGDCDGTWRNQMRMEQLGVRPLPCYHYGEPVEVLEWYISKYDYITIGGMVPISTPQLILWLDRIWTDHLTNPDGSPKIKVHGFGLTSLPLMFRYPWYSVDSSTWVQWAANGMILIPGKAGQVDISNKSSRRKQVGQHIDSVSAPEREAIEGEIRSFGGDPDRLREHYQVRWTWNIWAFPEYAKAKVWGQDKLEIKERMLF